MFAIVKIAGHQYKVEAGQQLYVPHIAVGKNVNVKVSAEILGEKQGDKVIAFKMKRRKGFRKKIGHRKLYTKIRIESIA